MPRSRSTRKRVDIALAANLAVIHAPPSAPLISLANGWSREQRFHSLQTLELKNQTAIGNLQAVQTGNEIALVQVQQVQMLRQLVMAVMNSENTAKANQLNNQTQSQLTAQAIIAAPPQVAGMPDFRTTTSTSTLPPQ